MANTPVGRHRERSLVTGLAYGNLDLAVSGSDLFIVNTYDGTIGEYTTSGAPVNASLISGLSHPVGIAVLGSNLLVANNGNGQLVNIPLREPR